MKLERIPHNPAEVLDFFEQGLASLGALCERTWYDRLQVVAEGPAARLWNADGAMFEIELQFPPADTATARDATREVFPGCPLTFHLSETLRTAPLPLERFVLPAPPSARPPESAVLEKLWKAQFSDTRQWQLMAPPKPDFHFSILGLARCEIQAIDQHWSLHRIATSLADGMADEGLAREIGFHQADPASAAEEIAWPTPHPVEWRELLQAVLEHDLQADLEPIRVRQANGLRRELDRIDDYFENYGRELKARARRSSKDTSKLKMADRLAAARAEHTRRRADQVSRHEIRVQLHLDALLLLAERAWRALARVEKPRQTQNVEALFVPRSRLWKLPGQSADGANPTP